MAKNPVMAGASGTLVFDPGRFVPDFLGVGEVCIAGRGDGVTGAPPDPVTPEFTPTVSRAAFMEDSLVRRVLALSSIALAVTPGVLGRLKLALSRSTGPAPSVTTIPSLTYPGLRSSRSWTRM